MTFELFSVSSLPLFLEYFFFSKIPYHFRLTCVILWFSYLCFLSTQQHHSMHFHFWKDSSTNSDCKKGTWKLSRMPFNWPPNGSLSFCPDLLPLILNIAARGSSSKCHSEHVSPVLNLSNGLGTSIKVSKILCRASLLYLSDIISISFCLFFFIFLDNLRLFHSSRHICFSAFGYSAYSTWNPALPWVCTLLAPFH